MSAKAGWWLAGLSVLYWLSTWSRANHELLQFDELVTWHVSRSPSFAAMLQLLFGGIDQEPPLIHTFVRWSHQLFGDGQAATRLPSMLAFWVLMLSLYALVRRYADSKFAFAALVLPTLLFVREFSYQARAYAILMAAASVAVLCWDRATRLKSGRAASLAGLSLSLAIALLSHMMGILIAIPFTAGELVRSWQRRKIDWAMWGAFALAMPAAGIYIPILRGARDFDLTGIYPRLPVMGDFYANFLHPAIGSLFAAAIAAYLVKLWLDDGAAPNGSSEPALPPHLGIALICFALLPAIYIAIGFVTRHFFFVMRYGVLATIGVVPLLAIGAERAYQGRRRCATTFALVIAGIMAAKCTMVLIAKSPDPAQQLFIDNPRLEQALAGSLPVVVGSPVVFAQAEHYLPEAQARRIYHLLDREALLKYPGKDPIYQVVLRMKQNLPLRSPVETFRSFTENHGQFLLHVAKGDDSDWLFEQLLRGGWRLTTTSAGDNEMLLFAERSSQRSGSE